MKSFIDNFKKFYFDSKSKFSKDNSTDLLFSYASNFDKVNFNALITFFQISESSSFYWNIPNNNNKSFAFGSIFSSNHNGTDRTEKTENDFLKLGKNFVNNWEDFQLKTIPLIVGGLKFSVAEKSEIWNDFEDSEWFIPEIIVHKKNEDYFLVFNFFANDDFSVILEKLQKNINIINNLIITNESNENLEFVKTIIPNEKFEWNKKVNLALGKISQNEIQKIVLSRKVELEFNQQPILAELLESLENKYPKCYVFSFKKGNSIFFGASPEKLAKISNGWIEADALAGSVPRGNNDNEDFQLEQELLNSKKNISEQKAVVEFIADSFSNFSEEIIYDKNPGIRKLPNIQHLWTPIKAKLNKNYTVFYLLKSIHPTPAICGAPWSVALSNIKELENFDRGLFAGITGWSNFKNEGEFAVSIRSGLLKENKLYAYAGCGIVEGSDPEQEFEETELKLKPILSLFKNEKVYKS